VHDHHAEGHLSHVLSGINSSPPQMTTLGVKSFFVTVIHPLLGSSANAEPVG
jgi:hypothetical protein